MIVMISEEKTKKNEYVSRMGRSVSTDDMKERGLTFYVNGFLEQYDNMTPEEKSNAHIATITFPTLVTSKPSSSAT